MKKTKHIKKTAREEEKRMVRQTIRSMMNNGHSASGTPHQMMKLSEMMKMRAHASVDLGYIQTLLYPELYNSDVPQPMSTQSYCRFTDKKELTIKSSLASTDGGAMLIWYPKTVIGPQLFLRYGNLETALDVSFSAADATANGWKWAGYQDYSPYFAQANLIAASISIQYIGQLQNEQGYFVGSQTYGISPGNLVTDDVENGQYRTMCKPGDGIRLTYLPAGTQDFTYYPCTKPKFANEVIRSKNNGSNPDNAVISLGGANAHVHRLVDVPADTWLTLPQSSSVNTATKANIQYSVDGNAIVIYWKGLAVPTSGDLRIDIIRKFNGFPLSNQREILDLTKPKKLFDPKKTIDVIQELQSAIPQLCGHSLKSMDRVSDQIQEYLPNIGHLYDEGLLKDGTTLEGFATQLQMINGTEGPSTGFPGRLYE